jgi:hypothetical protein
MKKQRKTFLSDEEIRKIKDLYLSGMTVMKMTKELNRNYETIKNVLIILKLYVNKTDFWTEEEDKKLIDLRVNQKMSYENIAKIFNCNRRRIKNRAERLDICDRYNIIRWTPELDTKLENLINQKLPLVEIAKIFNCTILVITKRCKRIGLQSKARRLIYTPEQLDVIKEFYYEGKQDIITAKEVHLTVDQIKHIRRREKIQNKKMQKWSEEDDNLLINLYNLCSITSG